MPKILSSDYSMEIELYVYHLGKYKSQTYY